MKNVLCLIFVTMLLGSSFLHAEELRTVEVSPKIRLIKEAKGEGGYRREWNKAVQFIGETGQITKEIPCRNGCSISPNKKNVALVQEYRPRYAIGDIKKMQSKGDKDWQSRRYPKDWRDPFVNVDIYNESGEKRHSVKVDLYFRGLYCSDSGEIVVLGQGHPDYNDHACLNFYDKLGGLVRSISEQEAKILNLSIDGVGQVIGGDRILWLGNYPKGGSCTLFDFKGNITWSFFDKYLSLSETGEVKLNAQGDRILVEASYREEKATPVKKTWIISQEGKIIEILGGWGHEIR